MSDFSAILLEWYAGHKRELPWRETRDPYRIWISEIILQQTRVAQGYEYFLRFVERFPDVSSLAEADEDEVMKYWQGLGYYSRARNLHAAARSMNGHFPQTYEGVRALKGVGDYTAAAICSIAYDMPYAVVDGNVYRVLSRIYGIDTPIDTTEGKKLFAALALPGALEILLHLHGRDSSFYHPSAIAKQTGLPLDVVLAALPQMADCELLKKKNLELEGGPTQVYTLHNNFSFVPFLVFTRWIMQPEDAYVFACDTRDRPILTPPSEKKEVKA